jgi:hypothetical protein
MYTFFDLLIQVTNSIPAKSNRPLCDSLNNDLMTKAVLNAFANTFVRIPRIAIQTSRKGLGIRGMKLDASTADGLGAVEMLDWQAALHWIWIRGFAFMFAF